MDGFWYCQHLITLPIRKIVQREKQTSKYHHKVKMKFLGSVLFLEVLISAGLCLPNGRSHADGGRIVGGFPVRIEEVPYQASLQFFGIHICGGVIISSTFILTACHCKFICRIVIQIIECIFSRHVWLSTSIVNCSSWHYIEL